MGLAEDLQTLVAVLVVVDAVLRQWRGRCLEKMGNSKFCFYPLLVFSFSAFTVLVGQQEGSPTFKKYWHNSAHAGSMLSPSLENCYCHRRDAALKPEGRQLPEPMQTSQYS